MKRLHALRELPYQSSVNWTLCSRHVEQNHEARKRHVQDLYNTGRAIIDTEGAR